MTKPKLFYSTALNDFEQELVIIRKQLVWSSSFRFALFLTTVSLVYFFFDKPNLALSLGVLGLLLFAFMIKHHGRLKRKSNKLKVLINLNKLELKVLKQDLEGLSTGKEYQNPNHKYSYDIDLFGAGSFFQYINRTATKSGKNYLADLLESNDLLRIKEKQAAIIELAQIPEWRQNFTATAKLIQVNTSTDHIQKWLSHYKGFTSGYMQYLPQLFLAINSLLIVLNYLDIIGSSLLLLSFVTGLVFTGVFFTKVSHLSQKANQTKDTFRQYFQLLEQLENKTFESELLKEKQNSILQGKQSASEIFKLFSKHLNALDQRHNMLFGVFANGLALWDIKQAYRIEQWIADYADKTKGWFDSIAFIDAYNSLAHFYFNHPDFVFPVISSDSINIQTKNLGHPLLNKNKRINNDFSIDKASFYIVTGANMAGKSTFLRTVSLSIVMANVGLPVCADSFIYSPIKLITSMRTTDSLSEEESYFFAELKRLKFVKEAIEKETHFIVLDEILKGTNSTDKAIGSRKFVQKLVASHSTGIIATHDLSLCEISHELEQVHNYYFDAEIVNDALYFDYKLKKGICQNMNASFLLKKMEIV